MVIFLLKVILRAGSCNKNYIVGNFQKIFYPTDLFMASSSALRQGLHITSMRPLARLEDESLYAIRVDYFLPVP